MYASTILGPRSAGEPTPSSTPGVVIFLLLGGTAAGLLWLTVNQDHRARR